MKRVFVFSILGLLTAAATLVLVAAFNAPAQPNLSSPPVVQSDATGTSASGAIVTAPTGTPSAPNSITVPNEITNLVLTILLVSLVVSAIAILTALFLYRWRKRGLHGVQIAVPEQFSSWVGGVQSGLVTLSEVITKSNAQLSIQTSKTSNNVSEIGHAFLALQSALDQRDAEIRRLRSGYDAAIFRKFLLRFVRVDRFISESVRDGLAESQFASDVDRLLADALAECGVEKFSPRLGADYRSEFGVADSPSASSTQNASEHFTIAEVIEQGYALSGNADREVIIPAKVRILRHEGGVSAT